MTDCQIIWLPDIYVATSRNKAAKYSNLARYVSLKDFDSSPKSWN